ncbi:MAG: L-lactate dehydrogenase [Phycisphaerales bacterium]
MPAKERKVVVIGAGSVGTAYIYALLPSGLAGRIVLIDKDQNRAKGEALDLAHGLPFIPPVEIVAGDYSECADADLIVVTAGAKQQSGQTRLDLIRSNVKVIQQICDEIKKVNSHAVLIMVTNPVDALTQLAVQYLGWPKSRVIGSGTVLDSARFRYLISQHCGVDAHNVHAYIIGEHGDSEVAAWSMTHIAGIPVRKYCQICNKCDYKEHHERIAQAVRDSAYHIIDYKGSTYYGIGLSLLRISQAVLRNEHGVLTVSTLLNGEYDIDNICLSIPCVIARDGVEKIVTTELPENEQSALQKSADIIRETLAKIWS